MGSPEAMLNLHLEKDMGPQLWAGQDLGSVPSLPGAVLCWVPTLKGGEP